MARGDLSRLIEDLDRAKKLLKSLAKLRDLDTSETQIRVLDVFSLVSRDAMKVFLAAQLSLIQRRIKSYDLSEIADGEITWILHPPQSKEN